MKLASVEALFSALDEAGVRYLVVGGLAVVAHGYVRYTADIDLVLEMSPQNLVKALGVLQDLGYRPQAPVAIMDFADAKIRESWIQDKGLKVFQLVSDRHSETAVDVFVKEPFDFADEYKQAPRKEIAAGLIAPVASIDTLMRMKDAAGRDKDVIDIAYLRRIRDGL